MGIKFLILYAVWINLISAMVVWHDWRFCKESRSEGMSDTKMVWLSYIGGAIGMMLTQKYLDHKLYRHSLSSQVRFCAFAQMAVLTIFPVMAMAPGA